MSSTNFHWILKMKNFEIKKSIFEIFQLDFQWKFLMEIFEISISKVLVGRFQNDTTLLVINCFDRDFFQSCVDFQGGEDGIEIQAIWSVWMPLQKKLRPCKKKLYRGFGFFPDLPFCAPAPWSCSCGRECQGSATLIILPLCLTTDSASTRHYPTVDNDHNG